VNKFQREYDKWVGRGSPVPRTSVPTEVKWFLLWDYADRYNLSTLIETGTATGDTITHVQERFDLIVSFEIMRTYFDVALANTIDYDHISLINASSTGPEFRALVEGLNHSALIYLDAHYSGENTGLDKTIGTPTVPIREELSIIMGATQDHVVIIDDARCFKGEAFHSDEYREYPSADDLQELVEGRYQLTHVADAFVLEPEKESK